MPTYFLKDHDTLLRQDGEQLDVWLVRKQKWRVYGLPFAMLKVEDLRRIDKAEADAYIAQGEAAKGPFQPSIETLEKIGRRGSRSTSRSRSE